MSFSKTAANETRKAVRRSQSYGLLPVGVLFRNSYVFAVFFTNLTTLNV